jgi:hypothetical protein
MAPQEGWKSPLGMGDFMDFFDMIQTILKAAG